MSVLPRCPRCGSARCSPCAEELYASDEHFPATHECDACHARFAHTPGAWNATRRDFTQQQKET